MVVVNTPKTSKDVKTPKSRTPLPVLTCDVSNCSFTSKQSKKMRDHKAESHEISPEESIMDASVNASALGMDETPDIPATPTSSQEEAIVHNSMDQHPHSTLKPDLSCPLETGERRGKKRKDDDEGGEGGDDDEVEAKREKIEDDSVQIIDDEPKSPATMKRERIMAEALLTIESEKQKAFVAQKKAIMNILDSGNSDKLATSATSSTSQTEEDAANQSRSLLESGDGENTMVMELSGNHGDDLSQQVEELPAEQSSELITQTDTNELVREIQEELDAKTRSLDSAISKKNTLETMLAQEIANRKYIEAKLVKAKADLAQNEDIVVNLQNALRNPAPPANHDPVVEGKLKKLAENNRVLQENNKILTAKGLSQKKGIENLRKKVKDAQAVAEGERRNAQSWEQKVNMMTGDVNQLKGLTFCKVEACPDEKTCGRSHSRKPENRKDCPYWLQGYCRREQRCQMRHDVNARSKAWAAETNSDNPVTPIGTDQGNATVSSNPGNTSNNRQPRNHQHHNNKKKGGANSSQPPQRPQQHQPPPPQQPPQLPQQPPPNNSNPSNHSNHSQPFRQLTPRHNHRP